MEKETCAQRGDMPADEAPARETEPAAEPVRAFKRARPLIRASCALFVCRVCRTKTGWPHQVWCEAKLVTEPGCAECRYWSEKKGCCDYPGHRRGGVEG